MPQVRGLKCLMRKTVPNPAASKQIRPPVALQSAKKCQSAKYSLTCIDSRQRSQRQADIGTAQHSGASICDMCELLAIVSALGIAIQNTSAYYETRGMH